MKRNETFGRVAEIETDFFQHFLYKEIVAFSFSKFSKSGNFASNFSFTKEEKANFQLIQKRFSNFYSLAFEETHDVFIIKIITLQKLMQKLKHSRRSARSWHEFQQIKFVFSASKSATKWFCSFSENTAMPLSAEAGSTTFANGIPSLKISSWRATLASESPRFFICCMFFL